MADDMYDRLMIKMNMFKCTHVKVLLPERVAYITNQYKQFLLEFNEETEATLKNNVDSIEISIKIGSTVTCDDGGNSLILLIGIANASKIDVRNNQILFKLWFRCWEWIDRS